MKRILGFLLGIFLAVTPALATSTTVPSDFFSLQFNNHMSTVQWPPFPVTATRIAFGQYTTTTCNWAAMEPSAGVYDFSCLDSQMLPLLASHGVNSLMFTFNKTPSFYQTVPNVAAPPDNLVNYTNFVKALVIHEKGVFKYYESWNEWDNSTCTSSANCTTANILSMAESLYSIVKTYDPNAIVLEPSTSSQVEMIYESNILALAAGTKYFNGCNYHEYYPFGAAATVFTPISQTFYNLQTFQTVQSDYGISCPQYVDEGGLLGGKGFNNTQAAAATFMENAFLAAAGVQQFSMYNWNTVAPTGVVGFWNGNLSPNNSDVGGGLGIAGTAYAFAERTLKGATFTSNFSRTEGTNVATNPNATGSTNGVIPGGTGVAPTNWSVQNNDSARGVTVTIVGTGSIGPGSGLEVEVSGTYTGGGTGQISVLMDGTNTLAVNPTDLWYSCLWVQLVAGSMTNITNVLNLWQDRTSGGSFIDQATSETITYVPSHAMRYCISGTPSGSTVAFGTPVFGVRYPVGVPFDATFLIRPGFDNGHLWTATFTKPGGYQGEIVWDEQPFNVRGTQISTMTPDPKYTYYEDPLGNVGPITNSTVTLNNGIPVVLENQTPTFSPWTSY